MIVEFITATYTLALPIILGYIVWLLQRQKNDKDANTKGTMLLLRINLIEYHDRYMAKGHISSYAYENFCEMYRCYKDLGGDGMIEKMFEEIRALSLKKGNESIE